AIRRWAATAATSAVRAVQATAAGLAASVVARGASAITASAVSCPAAEVTRDLPRAAEADQSAGWVGSAAEAEATALPPIPRTPVSSAVPVGWAAEARG